MFTLLGLRHLCVVDERSHVHGIITRRNLDHAAGHGAWRRNKIAEAPERPQPQGASCIVYLSPTGFEHTSRIPFEGHRCLVCLLFPVLPSFLSRSGHCLDLATSKRNVPSWREDDSV